MRTYIIRCGKDRIPMLRVSKSGPGAPDCEPNRSTFLRQMRFVAGRGAVKTGRNAVAELHREANKRAQKEKGPKETLISLSGHSFLLFRKLTAADYANERSAYEHPANDACERTRWRSCHCNYAGIARKVAANARIA